MNTNCVSKSQQCELQNCTGASYRLKLEYPWEQSESSFTINRSAGVFRKSVYHTNNRHGNSKVMSDYSILHACLIFFQINQSLISFQTKKMNLRENRLFELLDIINHFFVSESKMREIEKKFMHCVLGCSVGNQPNCSVRIS